MIKISEAGFKDAAALFSLQKTAFRSEAEMIGSTQIPALLESEEDFLNDFSEWTVIKLTDVEILAGAIRYRKEGEVIEIGRLMIHPDYRRQGLARNATSLAISSGLAILPLQVLEA